MNRQRIGFFDLPSLCLATFILVAVGYVLPGNVFKPLSLLWFGYLMLFAAKAIWQGGLKGLAVCGAAMAVAALTHGDELGPPLTALAAICTAYWFLLAIVRALPKAARMLLAPRSARVRRAREPKQVFVRIVAKAPYATPSAEQILFNLGLARS
ncbi:MAG: hypothetical protein WDM81_20970 [Rhizomicrobium sp.]